MFCYGYYELISLRPMSISHRILQTTVTYSFKALCMNNDNFLHALKPVHKCKRKTYMESYLKKD